jgi:hypothetical protein
MICNGIDIDGNQSTGACVYYEEWNRKKPAANQEDEQNLIYGMLYAFKQFVQKTSPKP